VAIFFIWGTGLSVAPDRVGNAQRVVDPEYDELAAQTAMDVAGLNVAQRLREGAHAWAAAYETAGDAELDPGNDRDAVAGSAPGASR
jgi:hypothetical protein